MVLAASLTTWAIIATGEILSSGVVASVAILIAWSTISARGLSDAAREVELYLHGGDEDRARYSIRALVGRDPET